MDITKVTLPAGLINILREAAAIIANIDPDHAPANLRFPIVDELEGFASMLYADSQESIPGSLAKVRPLTDQALQDMRAALRRIYVGGTTANLTARLSDTEMADIAEPFALETFDHPSPEQQALHAIYLGRYCANLAKRLCDIELAEIAKPFVVVPDSSGPLAQPSSEQKQRYIVLRRVPQPAGQVEGSGTRQTEPALEPSIGGPTPSPQPEKAPDLVPQRNAAVADALKPFLRDGERVIWQERSSWHDEEGELCAPYCYKSLNELADVLGYDIVADYNHVAIIKPNPNR